MSAIPSPALALTRAFDRLERSGARVVNAAQSADGADLPAAIVDQMDAKAQARAQVTDAVKGGGYGPREIIIRINGLDSPWGADDLKAAVAAGPDAILIPKAASSDDIARASSAMRQAGAGETEQVCNRTGQDQSSGVRRPRTAAGRIGVECI